MAKVKYIIQQYNRYPIFEPAEGGYYYEGLEPTDEYELYDTKEHAIQALIHKVLINNIDETNNELIIATNNTWAGTIGHKYIGKGYELFVEPINRRKRHKKGKVANC